LFVEQKHLDQQMVNQGNTKLELKMQELLKLHEEISFSSMQQAYHRKNLQMQLQPYHQHHIEP
jgi:hypothetical protein